MENKEIKQEEAKNQKTQENTELEMLRQELEEKNKLIQDHINDLKRLQADFENHIKRAEKEKIEFAKYAGADLIISLLGVIDDFERALESMKNDENSQGMNIVFENLKKILEEEGVRPIISIGEKFDPYKHEVVSHLESNEHEEDMILQEFQRGYWLKDRIIRPSKVIISKKHNGLEVNENE